MKILIHIGWPKCFSTTLQRGVFSAHPDINFLGVGTSDNVSYRNDDLEFIGENLLKYANRFTYNKERVKARDAVSKSLLSNKINVFSSEYLSIKFCSSQIDTYEKYRRLGDLFAPSPVQILFIERDIESIIKSLYKEYIRMGYTRSFSEYAVWLWNFRDRNFFYDLDAQRTISELKEHFGEESILHYRFDEAVKDLDLFVNNVLLNKLGLPKISTKIGLFNSSLSDSEYLRLLAINKKYSRNLGEPAFHPFENHRNRVWFNRSEAITNEFMLYRDVYLKRFAIGESEDRAPHRDSEQLFECTPQGQVAMEHIRQELISWSNPRP